MLTPPTFDELLEKAKQNDAAALGLLLQKARPFLFTLAGRYLSPQLKSKAGESDLVQETCSVAIEGFTQFRGTTEKEFMGWLSSILTKRAATQAHHYLDTAKRDITREVPMESPSGEKKLEILAPDVSPSKAVSRLEERETATKMVQQLPESMREVVILRFRDNLSFEAIAQRLGKTEDAVKKMWARAMIKFKPPPEVLSS